METTRQTIRKTRRISVLQKWMHEHDVTETYLSKVLKLSKSMIHDIKLGRRPTRPSVAVKLEGITGLARTEFLWPGWLNDRLEEAGLDPLLDEEFEDDVVDLDAGTR